MEPRRLLSATMPAGYVKVDTLTVPSDGTWVASAVTLRAGTSYFLEASGTWTLNNHHPTTAQGDAEFATIDGWATQNNTRPDSTGHVDYGLAVVNAPAATPKYAARKNPNWGAYQSDHVYGAFYTGAGKAIDAGTNDDNYADNAGTMTLDVYAPITLTSLTVSQHGNPSNAATGGGELYVPAPASGGAVIDLAETLSPSTPGLFAQHMLWAVTQQGAPVAGGNFSTAPVVTLPGGCGDFVVTTAFDDNADGRLDAGDTLTQTVNVHVVQFSSLTVTDHDSPTNAATAAVGRAADLYVAEDPTATPGSAVVDMSALFSGSGNGAGVNWSVSGSSWAGANSTPPQNFSSDPTLALTPTGGNYDFQIKAWVGGDTRDVATTNVHVYTVDLQFNGTTDTGDDILMLSTPADGSGIPANQPSLDASVATVGDAPPDLTVSLDNPDGSLGFGTDAPSFSPTTQPTQPVATRPTTQPFTLPANHSAKHVPVFGLTASASRGDASVRVIGNANGNVGGIVLGKRGVTVFWFNNANITVTANGTYNTFPLANDVVNYTIDKSTNQNASAVRISAQATINVAGMNGNAPQLANLRIGIVQNEVSSTRTAYYANPQPSNFRIAHGNGSTPAQAIEAVNVPNNLLDVFPVNGPNGINLNGAAPPLYDGGGAIQIPMGLAGGGVATAIDTPMQSFNGHVVRGPVMDANNNPLGNAVYSFDHSTISDKFTDWVVLAEQVGNAWQVIAPLAQTGWTLNADSGKPQQQVVPDPDANGGSPPTLAPNLDTTTNDNKELRNAANKVSSTAGDPVVLAF